MSLEMLKRKWTVGMPAVIPCACIYRDAVSEATADILALIAELEAARERIVILEQELDTAQNAISYYQNTTKEAHNA